MVPNVYSDVPTTILRFYFSVIFNERCHNSTGNGNNLFRWNYLEQPSTIGLTYKSSIYHFFSLGMGFLFLSEFHLSHGKASHGISVLLKNEAFSYSA